MRSSRSAADPLDPGPAGFAHRGLHDAAQFPENSLLAFAAALELGAGIECDLRLTADDRIVVFHDADGRRMCGSPLRISQATLCELGGLRLGEGQIPTLESALELVAGHVPLLLEVKVYGDIWRWVLALRRALADYRGPFGVMSFDPRLGRLLKTHLPVVRRGLVVRDRLVALKGRMAQCSHRPIFSPSTAPRSAGRGSPAPGAACRFTAGPSAGPTNAGKPAFRRTPSSGKPMADREAELIARLAPGVAPLDAQAWDRLAAGDPFLSHAFLSALENSGSVGAGTGWSPAPLTVEDQAGTLLAAAPAYLKSHSQGEYVFDHAWADAFERAGGQYYPKLQIAVPFTPVPGQRLLGGFPQQLLGAAEAVAEQNGLSSVHITFIDEAGAAKARGRGWMSATASISLANRSS